MKASIIQPCFVPWIGYFEQMLIGDIFIYMDDVQYTKKDWRNRNQLKSPDGAKYIHFPVKKTSRETLINEVLISYNDTWENKLISQIKQWYKGAPNTDQIITLLEEVFSQKHEKLVDLNLQLNNKILAYIGIEKEIRFTSEVPRYSESKNDRIIEICKYFDAELLYDGKSAEDFIDKELFQKNNIEIIFQDYQHKEYPQLWGDFLPYMSILDLLMNVKDDYLRTIVSNNNPKLIANL